MLSDADFDMIPVDGLARNVTIYHIPARNRRDKNVKHSEPIKGPVE